MGYFDADKEWEIAILFLVNKDLISEYREFHAKFISEERELAPKGLARHYANRIRSIDRSIELLNEFTDSPPKKKEEDK